MQQFNYPTIIYYGPGSLVALAAKMAEQNPPIKKVLIVTDSTIVKVGLSAKVEAALSAKGIASSIFDGTHPNPIEEDVEKGLEAYQQKGCDALIALGGGSPIDTAKVIRFMATHPGPLAQYDDAKGGDKLIHLTMPPLFAIPTTSGTGSEVGRSGVILMRATGKKTIFFHPKLMPDIAVLEPELTAGLPPSITVATGLDAFTHCLEAYFVPSFHPLADGIALEGMRLILKNLTLAYADGTNLQARGAMQMAAAMGAAAFQKGLGMVHSLAHPLSARYNTHHGLANALLLADALAFLESQDLNAEARGKFAAVLNLFRAEGLVKMGKGFGNSESGQGGESLAESCRAFIGSLGVTFGLGQHKVPEADLVGLAKDAIEDTCHATNMIPVTEENMLAVYRAGYPT